MARRRRTLLATCGLAAVACLSPVPAQAIITIPEGGAITPDSVYIIHFQVRDACEGAAMDSLEVTVPASVENPVPEAVPGWDVVVEPGTADEGGTVVRWTGGPLEGGQFQEFGLWARFPDDPGGLLAFPAIQLCGSTEIVWEGTDGETPAPTVALAERVGQQDLQDLGDTVAELVTQVDELSERLADVNPTNLRARVTDAENGLEQLVGRVSRLAGRIEALEDVAPE
jgi:uncharacterized protein YcnI